MCVAHRVLYTIYSMKHQALKNIAHKNHVLREAPTPRLFFWRVNNHIAYTIIILTAYFLTARILIGTADLIQLSHGVAQDQVVHSEQVFVLSR